jgi:hypothetical protein
MLMGKATFLLLFPVIGIQWKSANWLGRQDSNLGWRNQNPLPYHLATPQQIPILRYDGRGP